jgi:hypothetical protein
VLVVWSESLDAIIPTCQDFEDRLIKLLWRSRPTGPASSNPGSLAGSVFSHSSLPARPSGPYDPEKPIPVNSSATARLNPSDENDEKLRTKTKVRRNWYGRKVGVTTTSIAPDVESGLRDRREAKLYAPIYNGLAAGLSFVFIGQGVKTLLEEWSLDGSFMRFVLCAITPLLWCVSLVCLFFVSDSPLLISAQFFALQLIQNITMWCVPLSHDFLSSY